MSREEFLQNVRAAVTQGNRPGAAPSLPERGSIGYQGGGADLAATFGTALAAAGGHLHRAANPEQAAAKILELVEMRKAGKILLGCGPVLDSLGLHNHLQTGATEVIDARDVAVQERDQFFDADLGVSPVDFLIAETGSIVVAAKLNDPRSLSLLPPIHVAVASVAQLVPDVFDLFAECQQLGLPSLPSGLTVITGPSKTGDIELKLVTGVHGPGEVHVVLVDD